MWTYAGTVLRLCAQIGFTAVLARVLGPTPFGIAGMAVAVLGAASFIAEQGLGSALVQRERLDDRQIRIACTRLMLTGLCLAALGVIGAPWIAAYFKEPRLVMPMQVLSLIFVPSALAVVSGAMLRRSLRFKALQVTQLASYLGPYGLIGIPLALAGFGVWALVAAMLGQAVLGALLMSARPPRSPALGRWYRWAVPIWLADSVLELPLLARREPAAVPGRPDVRGRTAWALQRGLQLGAHAGELPRRRGNRGALRCRGTFGTGNRVPTPHPDGLGGADRHDLPADLRRRRGAR
jgi:hypothetical protein